MFALSVHMKSLDALIEEFEHIFHGIGCLKDKSVSLHIENSVQLVVLRHRRVAFRLRPKVEERLHKMIKAGVNRAGGRSHAMGLPHCRSQKTQTARQSENMHGHEGTQHGNQEGAAPQSPGR